MNGWNRLNETGRGDSVKKEVRLTQMVRAAG